MTNNLLFRDNDAAKLQEANLGLWYMKYCNTWVGDFFDNGGLKKEVLDKVKWVNNACDSKCGVDTEIETAIARRDSLLDAVAAKKLYMKTASSFVTGMGIDHPIENGFAWHWTLGTPYLPGSSVKGLVREVARTWADNVDDEQFKRIFGSNKEHNPARGDQQTAGSVVFWDALPTKASKLIAEIMTPHYGPYYASGEVPGDWHDPVPICFLAVEKGSGFQFAVSSRKQSEYAAGDLTAVNQWLEFGLINLGAGAKTATGFGVFVCDETRTQQMQKEAAKAELLHEWAAERELSHAEHGEIKAKLLALETTTGEWATSKFFINAMGDGSFAEIVDEMGKSRDLRAAEYLAIFLNMHFKHNEIGIVEDTDRDSRTKGKKKEKAYKASKIQLAELIAEILSGKNRRESAAESE